MEMFAAEIVLRKKILKAFIVDEAQYVKKLVS